MKGGNGVREANGITHSPIGEPKPGCVSSPKSLTQSPQSNFNHKERKEMKGGNGKEKQSSTRTA